MYADIVLPLKLRPLTYMVPDGAPADLKGRIVEVPLGGRSCFGVVTDIMDRPSGFSGKNIRQIKAVYRHFSSPSYLSFLKWLADYYLTPDGVVLKSAFFEDAVKAVIGQKSEVGSRKSEVRRLETAYKTSLYHASSTADEIARLVKALEEAGGDPDGAIILVPEIRLIERLAPVLSGIFGERLCTIHSRLTGKKRTEAIGKIISGRSDVVIGTRSAVLAPLERVSFIAVLEEHNTAYKGEESPRYNGRDAAVMRGFIEKAGVFLSSACPSVESVFNSMTGKYASLPAVTPPLARPKTRIMDLRSSKNRDQSISAGVLKEAKLLLQKKEKLLFLVNRKGYSLVKCEECGHIAACPKCNVSLVFSKVKGSVNCNYCGYVSGVPDSCKECGGFHMKPFGTGTERIKEEIGTLLGAEATVVENAKPGNLSGDAGTEDADLTSFIIGTGQAVGKIKEGAFAAAVLLNIDAILSRPDFRAYERAFQEVVKVSQLVRPDGNVLLQTWDAKNRTLKFIRDYDFGKFYEAELSQRKALEYPPYTKIVLVNVFANEGHGDVLRHMEEAVPSGIGGLEVLGPVEIPSSVKSYRHSFQVLLKSGDRKLVHAATKEFLKKLEILKKVKINTDVDPYRI